jgi:hypothetical protein
MSGRDAKGFLDHDDPRKAGDEHQHGGGGRRFRIDPVPIEHAGQSLDLGGP